MAYTRIGDVFVPQVLSQQISAEMDTRSSALIRSGAVVNDSLMAATAAQNKGSKLTMPQYHSFTAADKVGNDTDPGSEGTTGLLTSNSRTSFEVDVPMLRRVVNFDAMDLARAEANADPLGDVAAQAADQIIANQDAIVISSLAGVLADNSNDSNDMLTDISNANTTIAAKNKIQRSTVIDAVAQWGDFGNQAAALVMHSAVYYQLLKDDTTSFRQEGEQGFVGSFMGIPVVLEDRATVIPAVTSGTAVSAKYTTYVLGAGAVGYSSLMGSPVYDRNEKAGNGWGGESIIVRRTDLVNPRGVSFSGSTANVADSELVKAASWNRAFKRKNIAIAFIRSNVA